MRNFHVVTVKMLTAVLMAGCVSVREDLNSIDADKRYQANLYLLKFPARYDATLDEQMHAVDLLKSADLIEVWKERNLTSGFTDIVPSKMLSRISDEDFLCNVLIDIEMSGRIANGGHQMIYTVPKFDRMAMASALKNITSTQRLEKLAFDESSYSLKRKVSGVLYVTSVRAEGLFQTMARSKLADVMSDADKVALVKRRLPLKYAPIGRLAYFSETIQDPQLLCDIIRDFAKETGYTYKKSNGYSTDATIAMNSLFEKGLKVDEFLFMTDVEKNRVIEARKKAEDEKKLIENIKAHKFTFIFPEEDEGKTFYGYEWGGKTNRKWLGIDAGILKMIKLDPSALEDAPMSIVTMKGFFPRELTEAECVDCGRAIVSAIEERYKVDFHKFTDYCYSSSISPKGLRFDVYVGVHALEGPNLVIVVFGPQQNQKGQ